MYTYIHLMHVALSVDKMASASTTLINWHHKCYTYVRTSRSNIIYLSVFTYDLFRNQSTSKSFNSDFFLLSKFVYTLK